MGLPNCPHDTAVCTGNLLYVRLISGVNNEYYTYSVIAFVFCMMIGFYLIRSTPVVLGIEYFSTFIKRAEKR